MNVGGGEQRLRDASIDAIKVVRAEPGPTAEVGIDVEGLRELRVPRRRRHDDHARWRVRELIGGDIDDEISALEPSVGRPGIVVAKARSPHT